MTATIRAMNQRLGAPGRVAILLLAVAVVVLLFSVRGLGRAILAPSAKEVQSIQNEKIKQLAAEYGKTLEQQAAQFTGRSVFFIPSPPAPKPAPPPPEVKKDPEPPPPPPAPTSYGGPKLIAMVNSQAWFEDGQKLGAGAEGKDGLKIKEVRPPWEVAVVWKDKDFTVSLFDRDKVIFPPKQEPKPEARAESKETPNEATKPEPSKSEPAPEAKPGDPRPDGSKPESPKPNEPDSPKPVEQAPGAPKPEAPKPAEPPAPPKPDQPA